MQLSKSLKSRAVRRSGTDAGSWVRALVCGSGCGCVPSCASAKRVRGALLRGNGLPVGAVTNRLAVKVPDLRQRRAGFGVKSACWPSCARGLVTKRRRFRPGCAWLRRGTGAFMFNSVLVDWYRYAVTELGLNSVASGLLLALHRFYGRIAAYS